MSDALTYADQTTDPAGRPTTLDTRMAEALQRHGVRSPHALAQARREPYLRAIAGRVEDRLADTFRST